MTELQKIEFEMLRLFVNICNELGLTYYLVCGSALGAVKYEGFIPWDDDIDVALPRKDYEIFLKKAQEMLPEWCFVQNYRTDSEFHLLGTKLRDSRTTFVEQMCGRLDINHGVFIDVFPLDGGWNGLQEKRLYQKKRRTFEGLRRVHLEYRRISPTNILPLKNTFYYCMNRCFGVYEDTAVAVKAFDEFVASFAMETAQYWCNYGNSASLLEYAPKTQYGNGTWATFEGMKVRVPENYDEYLTQKYGDWRADLPEDQKEGHHYTEIMDLDRPYTDYIEHLKNGKIRIKRRKE